MLRHIFQLLLTASLLFTAACEGSMDMLEVDPETGEAVSIVERDNPEEPAEELPPAFELKRENVQLLPFHVRLDKLSRVTGATENDPIFDELRASRYDLGDHNFAQGIGPDLTWNSSKMALWVETLKPVCNSQQMRDRYPFLPEHLNEMLTAAYGREATQDDLAAFEDVLATNQAGEAETYEAVCLAVLTSTEFVGR
jgi:hypothetical protein